MLVSERFGILLLTLLLCACPTLAQTKPADNAAQNNTLELDSAAESSALEVRAPYLDWPMAQLTELIPELKTLEFAADQKKLSVILQNMGRTADDFVRNVGDLIAHEDVTQEKLDAKGKIKEKERVQDNYLILHHGSEWGANAEYRMDDKGNRLVPIGLEKGYIVTSGYALNCINFCTVIQPQSTFRYLGDTKLGSRETYVLGFAQKPGQATFTTTITGTGGRVARTFTQGILWVDKKSFQILRMRSDLLIPNAELRVERLTTYVTYGEERLQDVANPLWLPSDVDVYVEIRGEKFRKTTAAEEAGGDARRKDRFVGDAGIGRGLLEKCGP